MKWVRALFKALRFAYFLRLAHITMNFECVSHSEGEILP